MKRKNNYLDNNAIMKEWIAWTQSAEYPDDRTISEEMGKQMLTLAQHVMQSRSFIGYKKEMKEEMVSDGVVKIMKNLKNFNPEKGSIFSYWTRCVFTAATTYLANYYKDINRKRQLLVDALKKAHIDLPPTSPNTQDLIKTLERQLEIYGTEHNGEVELEMNKTEVEQ